MAPSDQFSPPKNKTHYNLSYRSTMYAEYLPTLGGCQFDGAAIGAE